MLNFHMGNRILLPVDGSEHAMSAVSLACEMFSDATLVLLHIINPAEAGFGAEATIPSFPEGWYEDQREGAKEIFDDIEADASNCGFSVERVIELGKPSRTIVEYAAENNIDHIVMGSHGRQGVSRLLLGSVTESVVRRSPVPVTVTR